MLDRCFPGAAPQAGIERAFGPYILLKDQGLRELRALKARSISVWGAASGKGERDKWEG